MSLIGQDIDVTNAAEWDDFAARQPYHNAFQSAKMLHALKKNHSYTSHGRLFRHSESSPVIGGYVFQVAEEISGLASPLATRAIVNGGPLISENGMRYCGEIIEDLLNHADLQGVYVEIWHGEQRAILNQALETAGFTFSDHLNFHLDLTQPQEELWNAISKRRRQYIRKNEARLAVRDVTDDADFEQFYTQLQRTYSRVRVPLLPSKVFKDCWLGGIGWFLLAEHEGQIVASRVALPFGTTLYDWYAGSDEAFAALHANESLVWHVLQRGQREGYHRFDFGGAGKPDKPYGPREFKAKFGAPLQHLGRHRYVLSPIRARILDAALSLHKKLFSRKIRQETRPAGKEGR